jgi:hypothetical protein
MNVPLQQYNLHPQQVQLAQLQAKRRVDFRDQGVAKNSLIHSGSEVDRTVVAEATSGSASSSTEVSEWICVIFDRLGH